MEVLSIMRAARRGEVGRAERTAGRMRAARRIALLLVATACVTPGGRPESRSHGAESRESLDSRQPQTAQTRGWRVTTKEQVDLWLHGFALLTSDTGHVPFFARGYKQRITALKAAAKRLHAARREQQELSARFATNPALTNAQFLAMYFTSFQEIVDATDFFIRSTGNPRARAIRRCSRGSPSSPRTFHGRRSQLAAPVRRGAAGREQAVLSRVLDRAADARRRVRAAVRSGPDGTTRSSRASSTTRSRRPVQLVLSLPLGGEGRTVNDGKQANIIAVVFPRRPSGAGSVVRVRA